MVQRLDCRIIKFLCRHCAAFSFCREVVKLAATRLIALHKNKGKSVAEIDIRRKYNVNIIATKKKGEINAVVTADTILSGDETLLVLGEQKAMRKCFDI